MRSTLCEAVARCHLRRLRGVAAAAPLPAAIVALVVVTAPVILFRLGGAVGDEVAGSIGTAGVSDALVLGPLLAAAVAGAALAVAAPPRSALGYQVAAGPSGAAIAVVGAHARPRGSPARSWSCRALVALCAGLARALPGGAAGGVALAAATLAAVPAGAVVAEGGLAAGRRQHRRAVAVGVGVPGLARGRSRFRSRPARATRARAAGAPWRGLPVARARGVEWRRDRARWRPGWLSRQRRAEPRSRRRRSGAFRSTAPAGADCRGRAARAEDRSEARDARGSALRPRRVGACGRDRRASARIVLARHDDGIARVAPVPTRRRRGARRAAAGSGGAHPSRAARSRGRSRSRAPCGRAPGRGRRQRRRRRLWCGRWDRRHRRGAGRRRLVRGTARGRLAPVARHGSRRSADDHRRVRGDRDRRVARRRARRPATRVARRSRPGRRGGDLRRVPCGARSLRSTAGSGQAADDCRDGHRHPRSRRRHPAGAAARRGAWPCLAVERERGVRARARRASARGGRERARRRVLAAAVRGAR